VCRKFLRFLQEKGVLARNYLDLIDGHRIDKMDSPYVALTDDEVRRMIETPDQNTMVGASKRLALMLGFYLGLRCTEISSIKHEDIVDGVLTVIGKGRKVRRIPLSDTLLREVGNYVSMLGIHKEQITPKMYLIQSRESFGKKVNSSTIWRWFTLTATECGITEKQVSPHSSRATAITKALDNGAGIREVAILAGHVSIETTAIYDKRRGEASRLAVNAIKY
jgi:integrase/recombinase XerD